MNVSHALRAALGRTPADEFIITFLDNEHGLKAVQALEGYDYFAFDPNDRDNDAKIRAELRDTVKTNWTYLGRTITCYPKFFMFRGSTALNVFANIIAVGIADLSINGQTVI